MVIMNTFQCRVPSEHFGAQVIGPSSQDLMGPLNAIIIILLLSFLNNDWLSFMEIIMITVVAANTK